jgi:hypothetical protein
MVGARNSAKTTQLLSDTCWVGRDN